MGENFEESVDERVEERGNGGYSRLRYLPGGVHLIFPMGKNSDDSI